jgi:hypothetical protein
MAVIIPFARFKISKKKLEEQQVSHCVCHTLSLLTFDPEPLCSQGSVRWPPSHVSSEVTQCKPVCGLLPCYLLRWQFILFLTQRFKCASP